MTETSQTPEAPARNSDDRDDSERRIGRTIDDRYRLEAYLGGGGMGDVYRARHTLMQKTVALKLLRPDVSGDDSVIERFRREAAAAANLEHPNICSATDFGKTSEGYFFLVMEFVDGRSLRDVLDDEGPLPVDRAAAIADGVAAALQTAAELDVVHRDIKPDNVMLVDREGGAPEVKVLDFGIAHVEFNDQMSSLTKTGAVFGTPTYMSPEQATGDEVEHRSDLYGLGAVLFEMLTGRKVFEEENSARLMAAHITERPEAPSSVRAEGEIPGALDEFVLELLAKKPRDRPASAEVVRERLRPFLADASESAPSGPTAPGSEVRSESSPATTLAVTTRRIREWMDELDIDSVDDDALNVALLALAGALGTMLFGLVVLSLVLTSSSPEQTRESLEAQRAEYKTREEIAAALEPLDEGRPADAVENLRKLREARGDSASAHLEFLLGKSYDRIGNERRALGAYRGAVEARRAYLYDDAVLALVEEALRSRDSDLTEEARTFVGAHRDHPGLQNRIARLAWKPESSRVRDRAHDLLSEYGLLEEIPEWQRLSIELRRADGCDEYEQQIAALVEHGDPRGARMIRLYDEKSRRGCGVLGLRDCYKCVRDRLDEALETLEE